MADMSVQGVAANRPVKPVAGDAATKGKDATMVGEYVIGKVLGQGSFGEVKLGTHIKTKKKVAIKIIEHEKRDLESLRREQRILKLLSHPSIVQLHETLEVPEAGITFLILEFVGGGELFDYIVANRRIREPEAIKFFRQIVSGVEYCHAHCVIHRDLKPENILLDDHKNVKINDFGLSNVMRPGEFLTTLCGSPLYLAPEIIQAKPYVGPEVDVWSLGVILFAMVTGYLPWDGEEKTDQLKNAVRGRYEIPKHVSPACRDLIDRMLTVDPRKRAVIDEIRTHAWMCTGFDGPALSCLPPRPHLTILDEDIITSLVDTGIPDRDIRRNVLEYNKITREFVLYHLMADRKRREAEEAAAAAAAAAAERDLLSKRRPSSSEDESRGTMQRLTVSSDNVTKPGRRFSIVSYSPDPQASTTEKKPLTTSSPNVPIPVPYNSGRRHSVASSQPNSPTALPSISHDNTGRQGTPPSSDVRPSSATSAQQPQPVQSLLGKWFKRKPVTPVQVSVSPASTSEPEHVAHPHPVPVPASTGNVSPVRRVSIPALPVDEGEALERILPPMKGPFNAGTVSTKAAADLKQQLMSTLDRLGIKYAMHKPFCFRCQSGDVAFTAKICKIEKFAGMKGIRFKRSSGDTFSFKQISQQIVNGMSF